MATVQGEFGSVTLFTDFLGTEMLVAGTEASHYYDGFKVIGDGTEDTDSGIVTLEADGLNGVGDLVTTNETKHGVYLATPLCLDVGKMGPIVMECRVQFADEDSKAFFMGLSDVATDALSIEDDVMNGATAALSFTASDLCAFYWDEGLTDDADWHAVYAGGTTTCSAASGDQDLDDDLVSGEWQIIRLEVDPNGDARWYIDGVLLKSVATAVSTTTDMAFVCGVESKASTIEHAYLDYVYFHANRDWTV